MVKKVITEEQLRAANKAGYSTQQIAGEINKYEKTTGNDAVYSGNLPNGQVANPGLAPAPAQTPVQTQPIVQKPNPDMIDTSTGKPASESPENTQYNILPESVTGVKPYISPTLQAKIDAKKTPVTPEQRLAGMTGYGEPVKTNEQVKQEILDNATKVGEDTNKQISSDSEKIKQSMVKKDELFFKYLKGAGKSDEEIKKLLKSGGYTDEEITDKMGKYANNTTDNPITTADNLTELSDAEKNAQATGVKYTMVNGLPEYEPTNKEEALKILQSGGKFSAENGMTAVAKANLDKYRKYAQMTDTQLAQNIVNGNVSSRELEQITSINPDLVAKAKDMARKSTITDTANTIQVANDSIVKGEDTQVQNKALTNLLTKLGELDANAESYGDIKARVYANYPDMEVARGEIVNAQTQLRQLQRAKRDLFADYKKKNSSLPISMIMAGYSALSKGIDDQIYEVNDTLSQNVALYNSYLDEAKSEIDWEVGNQEKQEQRLFDLYGVTSKEEIRQEDFARADKLLADELARADKADVAKIKQLEQERLDNVKEAIAKLGIAPVGETYEDLLGEYATAVKNQPSDIKTGLKAGDYYLDNGELKQVPAGAGVTGTAPAPSRTPTIKSSYTPEGTFKVDIANGATPRKSSRGYYECAMLVNDTLGTAMPDLHTDKLKYNNSNVPVVGGAFIEKTNDKYGHTGIVENINADGTINIVETNYPVGSGVTRKTIDPAKRNIVGYYDPQTAGEEMELSMSDVSTFNNSTYKPQTETDPAMKKKYEQFLKTKNGIMKQKEADINDVMSYSQGGKDLTDTDTKSLTKFSQALDQIGGIQKQIKDIKTGPVLGKLKQLNPYDTDAQVLGASLNALIPNLARGVYGEVGVLTDNDIRQYARTIPNLTQTNDVNNAVLALTLDTVAGGYKRQLQTLAAAGKDVSGFSGLYDSIKAESDAIKSQIPGFEQGQNLQSNYDQETQDDIVEMLNTSSKEDVVKFLISQGIDPAQYKFTTLKINRV